MKTRFIYPAILSFIFLACSQPKPAEQAGTSQAVPVQKSDTYYHYSIWWAFVNKVFDADLTVGELKKHGDVGLGSYDFLDGEMVMNDGVPYRIREDGTVSVAKDNDQVVYANAAFMDDDKHLVFNENIDYDTLRAKLNASLPSANLFYAFKIHGTFSHIKLGGLHKQEKPFKDGLDVLIPNRPVFEGDNITGTMIGFYCPQFIGNINVAGYHFHFIADDLKMGGHVMAFESAGALDVSMDEMKEYHFVLPDNTDFRNVKLEKEFQYKKN